MLLVTKLGIFCIQQELSKGNNISKSVSKRTVQVVSSQLFQEICIKSEKMVSLCLSLSEKRHDIIWSCRRSKVELASPTENLWVFFIRIFFKRNRA